MEKVDLKIVRESDLEEGFNTYTVTRPNTQICVVFAMPQVCSEREQEMMEAIFTKDFRSTVFVQFAIDDLEKGFDPNALQ